MITALRFFILLTSFIVLAVGCNKPPIKGDENKFTQSLYDKVFKEYGVIQGKKARESYFGRLIKDTVTSIKQENIIMCKTWGEKCSSSRLIIKIVSSIFSKSSLDKKENNIFFVDSLDNLDGGEGTDTLILKGEQDYIIDSGAYDIEMVISSSGDDFIYTHFLKEGFFAGGAGDDRLIGSVAPNWLKGGKGDDKLNGSLGKDYYFFDRGDGVDTIEDKDEVSYYSNEVFGGMVVDKVGRWYSDKEDMRVLKEIKGVSLGVRTQRGQIIIVSNEEYLLIPLKEKEIQELQEYVEGNNEDRIVFGEGIEPYHLIFKFHKSGDLVIGIKNKMERNIRLDDLADRLVIKKYANSNQAIEFLEFKGRMKLNTKMFLNGFGVKQGGAEVDVVKKLKKKLEVIGYLWKD